MNVDEAKLLLQHLRAGQTESDDPKVAQALALAREDVALNAWLTEQQRLDWQISAELNSIPIPPALRGQLLQLPQQRPTSRFLRPVLAMAASIALLGFVGWAWWQSRPVDFAALRQHILDQSWGNSPHLGLRSENMDEVRFWLSSQNLSTNFKIPTALKNARLKGCSVLHWHGHSVPVLCLTEGQRHVHLYVVDRVELVDVPRSASPVLNDYGPLTTVSWSQADKAYVMTGFSPKAFLKKFRKSGHWLLTT